jgi:hypothetical protein
MPPPFSSVYGPFTDRLLTVFHGFSPFLPFSENGRDDEPRARVPLASPVFGSPLAYGFR